METPIISDDELEEVYREFAIGRLNVERDGFVFVHEAEPSGTFGFAATIEEARRKIDDFWWDAGERPDGWEPGDGRDGIGDMKVKLEEAEDEDIEW